MRWRRPAFTSVELFFSSDRERQRDFFLFFPGTVVVSRCFEWGAEEILHLGDIEQPEAVEITLGSLGHFRRELLRDIARLPNPSELARHSHIQGFHQLDIELDMNVVVEVAPEGEEDRLVIVHVDRAAFSPGLRHLDEPGFETEAERYRADVFDLPLARIPYSGLVAAVPSFTRNDILSHRAQI